MSESTRAAQIARLQTEITTLEAAIANLASIPSAQQTLRTELAEKQHQLAALQGGGTLPSSVIQNQSGGINFGVGTTIHNMGDVFSGDKVMGDKVAGNKTVYHGPTINGNVSAGRDANLANEQTITNTTAPQSAAPSVPTVASSGPHLRLWLEDTSGHAITNLTVGDEAVLRLGVDGESADLPALSLQAEADAFGVDWPDGTSRTLVFRPNKAPRPIRWTLTPEQAGSTTLRVLVLSGSSLVQQLALTCMVMAAGSILAAEAVPLAPPTAAVPVGLALSAVASQPPRAERITLVIDQEREGYELRLIDGGRVSRCRLALTPVGVADLLAQARTDLLAVVHTRPDTAYTFQQHDLTIAHPDAEQALLRLARIGAYLWHALFDGPGSGAESAALGARLRYLSQSASLSVTVTSAHFPFPWPLLYDRDPHQPITVDGFWGFRHVLCTLPTSGRTGMLPTGFALATPLRALLGLNLLIDEHRNVAPHQVITPQRAAFTKLGVAATEVTTEQALRAAFAEGTDAGLVYLYCHVLSGLPEQRAVRPTAAPGSVGSTRIVLTESTNALTLRDLSVDAPLSRAPLLRGGPLVVLNACGSAELSAETYDGLVPYLLDQGARAVVGTECETPIFFGAAFGPALLRAFIAEHLPIGEALRATRRMFLDVYRNPLGLLYALYGSADLVLAPAELKDPS